MGRKPEKINPECGKRLKSLLKEKNMTGMELAERIHCTQQHVSRLVRGKASITPSTAQQICKVFPGINVGWILGVDERKTIHEVASNDLSRIKTFADSISDVIVAAATYLGYNIVYLEDKERRKSNISFFLTKEGDSQIAFRKYETLEIGDDIVDYAAFLLNRSIRKKKGLPNPSIAALGGLDKWLTSKSDATKTEN